MLFLLKNIKDDKYEKYIINISYKLSRYMIINSKSIILFIFFFTLADESFLYSIGQTLRTVQIF